MYQEKRNDLNQKLKGIKIDKEETILASGNIIMVVENAKEWKNKNYWMHLQGHRIKWQYLKINCISTS